MYFSKTFIGLPWKDKGMDFLISFGKSIFSYDSFTETFSMFLENNYFQFGIKIMYAWLKKIM